MGLAPYGEAKYTHLIEDRLIHIRKDGSFWMNMKYFNYCQGLTMTNQRFHDLMGHPPRKMESEITPFYMDIAASIQKVTEKIVLRMALHAHEITGLDSLCLAGGVALNCVSNGKVLRKGPFKNIWIQPAAGDAGGALGAAQFVWHQLLGNERTSTKLDHQKGSYLGPKYSDDAIKAFLDSMGATFTVATDETDLCKKVAQYMADQKVVGWFQGRMEFGPRALGARSILGDARSLDMQKTMNLKIKFRESFRPFAPSVLREKAHENFEIESDQESPYMLVVTDIKGTKKIGNNEALKNASGMDKLHIKRSKLQAITHVDYSARVQTVDPDRNPLYYKLISEFEHLTACPVIINTSFNVRGEPIVCTPEEAYRVFINTDMDVLAMGNCILRKEAQSNLDNTDREAHLAQFSLD